MEAGEKCSTAVHDRDCGAFPGTDGYKIYRVGTIHKKMKIWIS